MRSRENVDVTKRSSVPSSNGFLACGSFRIKMVKFQGNQAAPSSCQGQKCCTERVNIHRIHFCLQSGFRTLGGSVGRSPGDGH